MKVLHCINSPHIGGLERLVIELAIAQFKKGLEVSIMLDTTKGQYYDYLKQHNIPILISGIKGGFDINLRTYKYLKQVFNDFEIVHAHSFSPIRSLALKHSKAKSVYTMHGLSKNIRTENKIKYIFREMLKRHFLNTFDMFIANSKHTLTQAIDHYGLKGVRKKMIFNGVKLPAIVPDENSYSKDFVIGLVSRFTYRKRIDRLIHGFDIFLKKGGKGRLILVGDGEAFPDVKKQIQTMNLSDEIELVGYSNAVNTYYAKFDVCVHPSDNEGFGLVAVEAYSHGKPVIAFSDSGGLVEVIAPLEPDNIVDNETQLAARLCYYYEHRDIIKKNASSRISYAANMFSIQRMEQDYLEVYKTLI